MAKAKSYKLQGREWTVKDLAEELGLSTPRVHGLLKEHNEDIKAIFASRGITPKPADKGPKARLFDYKGKQWTVKQLAEEFGLSNVRVNRLIKEHDGDIEKIALSREKGKKENGASEIKKASETEMSNDKTDIAVDDEEIEFIKDSMTKETFLKYLDQEELSTRFNEGDIKFKILILFLFFIPTDCDSLELDLTIGDTQDFEEWIRSYCFSINDPEITFSFIHGNLNKDNNEFTIRVEESGDKCFYINYTMHGQASTTADAADPKREIRESYKLLEKVLTKTGIIFDETEKAPKTEKTVEKNQNKNNLFKIKFSYDLNDEHVEDSFDINHFSLLEEKIYSIIDNFKNKSSDEYFICEIYYCSDSEEDLIWELEIDDYENFILTETVSGIQFVPKLFKYYGLNYFRTLELSFEEFFKRLTGEKEKQIRPKRIEIMYETENNNYEEDIGVANNLDELKNLIEKCDLHAYSSKFYMGELQGRYSVGFRIYSEEIRLGQMCWFTDNDTFDEFLDYECDAVEPINDELIECFDMIFSDCTNKNLAKFIFEL